MRLIFLIYTFVLLSAGMKAQDLDIAVYSEKNGENIEYYADNDEWCPVSIAFEFELKNMRSESGSKFSKVLPPRSKRIPVTTLRTVKQGELFGYKYSSNAVRGDVVNAYDSKHIYSLPYPAGKTYTIFQGYNGRQTHQGENALDFSHKKGDEITAARGGIVIAVVDHNSRSCMKPECYKYNNYVLILHDDGSMADYAHIRKEGSLVVPGDTVQTGQVIALSGNVGYAAGPHLHFSVYLPAFKGPKTIKTLFRTQNGQPEFLKEGNAYSRIDD